MSHSDILGYHPNMAVENAQLRRQVARAQAKLEQLETYVGTVAANKSELSSHLLNAEGDRVSSTRAVVRLQVENSRLKEETELVRYDLTNKILALDQELQACKTEKHKALREADDLAQAAEGLERARRDLADEYIALKTNFMALVSEYKTEVSKNEELSMEIVNLIRSKDEEVALAAARIVPKQKHAPVKLRLSQASLRNDERIQSALRGYSLSWGDNFKEDILRLPVKTADGVEKKIQSDTKRFRDQLARPRRTADGGDIQSELAAKLEQAKQDLVTERSLAMKRQTQVSQLTARLITLAGENKELRTSNNHLQHKIKDLNDECGQRLAKYVQDIASHMDSHRGEGRSAANDESMAQYINKMLKDIKALHRLREEQLSETAQKCRSKVDAVVRKHEELLAAYRELEADADTQDTVPPIRLRHDAYELQFSDSELQSKQEREIQRLQAELRVKKDHEDGDKPPPEHQDHPEDTNRNELKQLVEAELSAVERDRAALVAQCALLEEQLKSSQQYIDEQLSRRKEDVAPAPQDVKKPERQRTAPV